MRLCMRGATELFELRVQWLIRGSHLIRLCDSVSCRVPSSTRDQLDQALLDQALQNSFHFVLRPDKTQVARCAICVLLVFLQMFQNDLLRRRKRLVS